MYQADPINDDTPLGRYVINEFRKLSDSLRNLEVDSARLKVWTTLPDKPRTGHIYYADGTLWNPGSGEGVYEYTSTPAWVKL